MPRIIEVRTDTTGRRTIKDDGDQLRILEGVTLDLGQNPILGLGLNDIRIDVRGTVQSTIAEGNPGAVGNWAVNVNANNSFLNITDTGSIIGATRGVRFLGEDNAVRND